MRFLLYGLAGLALGVVAAGALQIGFNVLRFLIQPDWLAGGGGALLIAVLGLFVAALIGAGVALGATKALGTRGAGALFAAVTLGLLLDPYFLAEFGWTGPARAQPLARTIALTIAAAGLYAPLRRAGAHVTLVAALFALAIAVYGVLPRFALVPRLGGQLDLAAMSPIYVLVFAKGLVLLLIAAAIALALSRRVSSRRAAAV